MGEFFIETCLLIVVICVIARVVLNRMRGDVSPEHCAAPADPISTYVDENYGSHFVDDPASVRHGLRRL